MISGQYFDLLVGERSFTDGRVMQNRAIFRSGVSLYVILCGLFDIQLCVELLNVLLFLIKLPRGVSV